MELKGIDVSKHQGSIDWSKVKQAGVEFAIIRIGYGGSAPVKDEKFEENYKNAKANGIKVGTYIYSYADSDSDIKKEYEAVINWLGGRSLDLPVYFDVEDNNTNGKLSKSTLSNYVKTFCDKIENAGYWAGIYASKSWLESKLDMNILKDYTVWVAQWANSCTYKGSYAMWQYTSDGSVNGISGRVDMNYQVAELGGKAGSTSSSNTATKKSNEELANEVIQGKWGNGQDRKNRLNSAGYDYQTVQTIVNQKLGVTSNYYPKFTGSTTSIVDALKAIGIDSSFGNRKKIASKNGISNYSGDASQNLKLLNLLKQGKLKK